MTTSIQVPAASIFDIMAKMAKTGFNGLPDTLEVPVPQVIPLKSIMDLSHMSAPQAREEMVAAANSLIYSPGGAKEMAHLYFVYKKWIR